MSGSGPKLSLTEVSKESAMLASLARGNRLKLTRQPLEGCVPVLYLQNLQSLGAMSPKHSSRFELRQRTPRSKIPSLPSQKRVLQCLAYPLYGGQSELAHCTSRFDRTCCHRGWRIQSTLT